MCGLIGAVGAIGPKEKDVVKSLFILDIIRGSHSSGVLSVNANREAQILKDEGTAFDLIDSGLDEFISGDVNLLLCHNRAATRGAIKKENAHPFKMRHIIGAHNGTIMSTWRLKDGNSFDVDSQAIFNNIAHEGIVETTKKVNGAFALTWYDETLHTLNIARNKERPLFYCFAKSMKTLFWASEAWMLYVALNRAGIEHYKITEVEVQKHYSLEVPVGKPEDVERFQSWNQVDIPEYVPIQGNYTGTPFNQRNRYNYQGYREDDYEDNPVPMVRKPVFTDVPGRLQKKDGGEGEGHYTAFNKAAACLNKPIIVTTTFAVYQGQDPYIRCIHHPVDGADPIEVRCFAKDRVDLWDEMTKNGVKYTLFAKRCSSVYTQGNNLKYYLVADLRTIKKVGTELVLPPPKKVVTVKEYCPNLTEMADNINNVERANNKVLDQNGGKKLEDQFYPTFGNSLMQGREIRRLCGDCSWCSNPPNLLEANEFVWLSHKEFVCPTCYKDPDKKYITNAMNDN